MKGYFAFVLASAALVCVFCAEDGVPKEEVPVARAGYCSSTGSTCDSTGCCVDECYACKCGTPWGANCRCNYRLLSSCTATGEMCDTTKCCKDECYTCRCGTAWGSNCRCDYKKMRCDTEG